MTPPFSGLQRLIGEGIGVLGLTVAISWEIIIGLMIGDYDRYIA